MRFSPVIRDKYVIRYMDVGQVDTKQDVWDAICEAVELAMEKLELPPLLFVSVVGTDSFLADEDAGFAVYQVGMRHVSVAGGDGPEELADDREHWLNQLKVSTVHEIVHYWQDLNGRLRDESEEECEREADEKACAILGFKKVILVKE